MKRIVMSILMMVAVCMCYTTARAQNYVMNQRVTIPFAAPIVGQPFRLPLKLPAGNYVVMLTVERADWDRNSNSVADMVTIGGSYLIQDRETGRDIEKANWQNRNGKIGWQITVPPNSKVYIFYSTIAPGGAAGRLTVEAMR